MKGFHDLDEAEAGLELLRFVAQEPRPVFSTRDELSQVCQHLAAIADTKCKRVARLKNASN